MSDQPPDTLAMPDDGRAPAPDVSVLIAAYNARDFLHTAIASAAAQAAPRLSVEIIVVDDASTDDTLAVARALAATHDGMRVVPLAKNGGPSAARNAGLDVARGAWIAVLDADDAFAPGHLAGLLATGTALEADIVLSDIVFHNPVADEDSDSGLVWPMPEQPVSIADYVRRAQPFTGSVDWGLLKPLFKRRFMTDKAVRYPLHSRHGEDFLLIFDALARGARLLVSPVPSYRYTTRESGWSRTRIDYRGQVDQARALMARADVRADADLVAALRSRIDALARWEARRFVGDCRDRRDFASMFRAAASSRHIRAEVGKLALGKTASMLGLAR